MNTKILMIASAIFLGGMGISLIFFPQEISTFLNSGDALILQLLGALYFGFAMINWTAKANLIGGIYGRPVSIGNFCHFGIGGLALVKPVLTDLLTEPEWIIIAIVYLFFGIAFGYIFFNHPKLKERNSSVLA
ncbi:hypothetical protein SAMN05421640_3073 [Ekhidna lutea]|uniref:Uncharacterized protein n=1 Tax=Ekhidna lutea TaxID=447679 RepID=A0A239L9R9_EKHLU|nr:hypothetical protein [Ekhidna lutea]SNT27030.1 hypothetical protein SAMN05421640_3073 [Ekhidna lutea]